MTERIRKLAKLYEEVSYQAMKESIEKEWKTKADWSIEERIAVALFVIRLMIVKEDFAAAEKFSTEREEFSKYKEIIDKNKEEIAKQYEKEVPVVNCVHYKDKWNGWCVYYGTQCPGEEDCLLDTENGNPCKLYNGGWCSWRGKKCPGEEDCQVPYEKRI